MEVSAATSASCSTGDKRLVKVCTEVRCAMHGMRCGGASTASQSGGRSEQQHSAQQGTHTGGTTAGHRTPMVCKLRAQRTDKGPAAGPQRAPPSPAC
jgi:hypothetical protein